VFGWNNWVNEGAIGLDGGSVVENGGDKISTFEKFYLKC
jgi:hypothetical protein